MVLSVLATETYASVDCFDAVNTICDELLRILQCDIPMAMLTDFACLLRQCNIPSAMLTDFACLFNFIVRSSQTSELRLMIDLAATREAYEKGEIDDIGWIRIGENLTDAFTKVEYKKALRKFMETRQLEESVLQWLVRSRPS